MVSNRVLIVGLLITVLATGSLLQTDGAASPSSGPAPRPAPCNLRNGFQFECYGRVLAVNPTPVHLGDTITLTVNPRSGYSFDSRTVIVLEPSSGVGLGVGLRTLCGGLRGGRANRPCPSGATKSMTLSVPNDGSLPAGYYLLRAENWNPAVVIAGQGICKPTCTEADGGIVRFVPAGWTPPSPVPTVLTPYISSLTVVNHVPGHEQCVPVQTATVTLNVQGHDFDPNGAQVVVSYIYFVSHGTFRTDYNGHDSRVQATLLQRTSNFLAVSVDLTSIHRRAGDPYALGGNYYVQVENPNGSSPPKVNPPAPFYFTALPYQGAGSRCQ